jgi:dsDNA-binding SOS-regulon protein
MAVIPMWQVDRDQSMHTSKAEADKHDLMLEIGDHFATAILAVAPTLAAEEAEAIGLFLSRHREAVAKLCKGSNDALAEAIAAVQVAETATVTALRAAN